MSSTTAELQSRRRRFDFLMGRTRAIGPARDVFTYLVERPIAAVFALWAICFPALYFALYGDIVESAKILSFMTVVVVMYLMIIILGTIAIAFAVSQVASILEKRRWSDRAGKRF